MIRFCKHILNLSSMILLPLPLDFYTLAEQLLPEQLLPDPQIQAKLILEVVQIVLIRLSLGFDTMSNFFTALAKQPGLLIAYLLLTNHTGLLIAYPLMD